MLWPLQTIAPICSWSMIKESKILFWCVIAGFLDATDRLSMFVFEHFEKRWKSYVGNCIFIFVSFLVFYKFAKHRQQQSGVNVNRVLITFKLMLQLILGMAISLPYNYMFLQLYRGWTPLARTIFSCCLIVAFYFAKLIISNVIINQHGIYRPDEGIIFSAGLLVSTAMVTRLTQARIDSLGYFAAVSLVHGMLNIVDKIALPVKEKLCSTVCKKCNYGTGRNEYFTHYTVHQSLISIITETTSVIMSNAAANLLVYYYKKEEGTGKRYDGRILFKDMLIRSSIAICIEFAFNAVALKLQNDFCNIPVLKLWRRQWKSIVIVHLIQIVIIIVYFAHYVDEVLISDIVRNSTQGCLEPFKRI